MRIGKNVKKVCAMALSASMIIASASSATVQAASSDYNLALVDGITFYDANKCGDDAGENNAFSWRGACHVNDGKDVGLDLTGGYHDCGDHVKFGITQGYAASVLAWSYYSYKDAFATAGAEEKTLQTLKHFCDYFINCHPNMFTFYYQVGDGGQDHSYWGAPEAQGDRSTVFKVDASNPGSDVCGEAAAALALMYFNYYSIDSSYAETCLAKAKTLYALGKSNYGLSQGQGFYTSSSYQDDLAWAASWLYKATGDASYLSDAEGFLATSTGVHQDEWTMCWDNMYTPAEIVMYQLTNNNKYLNAVKYSMNYWINSVPTTSGGLKYLTNWGCLRYSAAQSMIATQYYALTKDSSAMNFAKDQIDYILGDNPYNYSYIIGYGSKYPTHPHHRAANGYTYADSGNLKPAKNLLLGALVGGPSTMGDYYADDAQDYTASEVGIDYNAGFVGAVAGIIANGTFSNPSTSAGTPSVAPSSEAPVVTSEAPVVTSEAPVVTSEVPVVTSEAPVVTSEAPVVTSEAPSYSGDVVPAVDVKATTGSSMINLSCTIASSGSQAVDLSKLTVRYKYTTSDKKTQAFTCDNAGLQLSVSPWYVNMTSDVVTTFADGYVDITFNSTQTIATGAGSLNIGARIYNADWSNYSGLVDNGFEVYYDGQLVK